MQSRPEGSQLVSRSKKHEAQSWILLRPWCCLALAQLRIHAIEANRTRQCMVAMV